MVLMGMTLIIDGRAIPMPATWYDIIISWTPHYTSTTCCKMMAAGVAKVGAILVHRLTYTATGGWCVVVIVGVGEIVIVFSAVQDKASN
jgi:hypothetical protein